MVPIAKAPAELRKRMDRHVLGDVHRDLARSDDLGDTVCRIHFEHRHAVELADDLFDEADSRPAGLVPALQYQLEEFLRRSGITCEFTEDGVQDQLPDAVKTCVYRVVQEALHNCEKHSGARKVRVTVRQLNDALLAEVEDDGCGFASGAHRSTGLGLLGMRERSANAGGSLNIDSAPGQGTRIALRIPLAPAKYEVNA